MFIQFFCVVSLVYLSNVINAKVSKVNLYHDGGHRSVQFNYNSNGKLIACYLNGDRQIAKEALEKKKIQIVNENQVDTKEMREIIQSCTEFLLHQISAPHKGVTKDNEEEEEEEEEDFPEEYDNTVDRGFFNGLAIYPGTKWCGDGDIAENYDDLGSDVETDKCCREHDHCFDSIPKGGTKHNLTNSAIHTKSHCECDQKFKECLIGNNKGRSNRVGKLYFNLIQSQCFKNDHPIVECLEYRGIPFFWRSCQEYQLDTNQDPLYQFFDAKWYET